MNESGETGLPYDIEVELESSEEGRASHRLCQLEGLGRYLQSKPIKLFIIL